MEGSHPDVYSDSRPPTPGHPACSHETPERLLQSLVNESETRDVSKTYRFLHHKFASSNQGEQSLPEMRDPHNCSTSVLSLKQHLQLDISVLPRLGYHKQRGDGRRGACLLELWFLGAYAQQRGCWVIWQIVPSFLRTACFSP